MTNTTTAGIDPRAALDAAIDAVRLVDPVMEDGAGRRRIFVPDGYRLEPFDDPALLPPWVRQELQFDDRDSLVGYVNRFRCERTILIADYDAGTVTGHLDWHASDGTPGPATHRAVLRLRPSEEFARWDAFQGKLHAQEEFAAFLEENVADVVDPEPGVLLEISRDLEGVQGVTFRSSTRLESGDRAFVYETETRTKGDVKVPREFRLAVPLYRGEAPVEIRCALRFKVSGGALGLGFEWRRVEYQRQAYFAQLAREAAEQTGCPVHFGRVVRA